MIDAQDVFNIKDFQTVRLKISFENLTTNWKPAEDNLCHIIEVGNKQLVLELPAKSCNKGHNCFVKIDSYSYDTKKYQEIFTSTAKIVEIEAFDDCLKASLHLVQFDEKSWATFLALFSKRQDEINKFIEAMRH